MKPALIGFNSRIKVCGLQKVKLANPAPCKPTISEALLNKFTWSSKERSLKVIIEYQGPIKAPIYKDQEIGLLKVFFKDELISQHKIFSSSDVKKVNLFSRIAKSINYLIWGDV